MKHILIYLLFFLNISGMEDSGDNHDSKKEMYIIDINDEDTDISKLIIQLYYQKEDCSGYSEIVPYVKKNFLKLRDSQDTSTLVEELYRLHRTPHKRKFIIGPKFKQQPYI